LRYPVAFGDEECMVELEGKAYFEIGKDEKNAHQYYIDGQGEHLSIN